MSYEKKEARAIERIGEIIGRLDETGERLETAYDRLNSFFEREKAIHEIQNLIHEVKEMNRLEEKRRCQMKKDMKRAGEALDEIAEHFSRLEITFSKLDDADSKIKVFLEQSKALHEVKRILYYMGKYDKYEEKELDEICC